jgi:hypothetical protein
MCSAGMECPARRCTSSLVCPGFYSCYPPSADCKHPQKNKGLNAVLKPVISPTNRQKLEAKKNCDIIHPSFQAAGDAICYQS